MNTATDPARPEGGAATERILIRSGGRIYFVRVDDIDWVDAAGNYVRLYVKGETHLFRETMNAMEKRLDPARFARIHRSHMVNINRIKELQPHGGEHLVVLQNGVQLTLSRGYRDRLQERLGGVRT
jgi:two-component system, LytTR family, response regulator